MKLRLTANTILGCLLLLASVARAEEAIIGRDAYTVHPGDVLRISVWKEEDLQREALIRPDGHFSFPLAGDIRAEGRTVDQIRTELTERLSRYVPDLVVTVEMLKIDGNNVFVIGKVNRPGGYIMNSPMDVMQALTLAGGTATFANLSDIKVLRRTNGQQVAIPFHYETIEAGKKLDQNILLRAGDTVVVP